MKENYRKILQNYCINWLFKIYKYFVSPLFYSLGARCRFEPTCSCYAATALQERGLFYGFILSIWRLLRCHPFCKGGYDPVPMKKERYL